MKLAPTVNQLKWREPWLMRLRLHGDFGPRLLLSLVLALSAGSVFFLVGLIEKGWDAAPLAGAFGAVFIGGVLSLGVFFSPEGVASKVTISDQTIQRRRDTLGFGSSEHKREKWTCAGLACVIVTSEQLQQPFSVMVLPGSSAKKAAYVGVPSRIDLAELASFLGATGVHVESATMELANSVKADRPYRSLVTKLVVAFCIAVILGVVVTVAVAGNRIAGN